MSPVNGRPVPERRRATWRRSTSTAHSSRLLNVEVGIRAGGRRPGFGANSSCTRASATYLRSAKRHKPSPAAKNRRIKGRGAAPIALGNRTGTGWQGGDGVACQMSPHLGASPRISTGTGQPLVRLVPLPPNAATKLGYGGDAAHRRPHLSLARSGDVNHHHPGPVSSTEILHKLACVLSCVCRNRSCVCRSVCVCGCLRRLILESGGYCGTRWLGALASFANRALDPRRARRLVGCPCAAST